MPATHTSASHLPGRMESHSAHEELARGDPETFHLHVEFVHAHGIPRGQFTTFSTRAALRPNGARGK